MRRREEKGRAVKKGALERVRGGKWRWPLKLEKKRYCKSMDEGGGCKKVELREFPLKSQSPLHWWWGVVGNSERWLNSRRFLMMDSNFWQLLIWNWTTLYNLLFHLFPFGSVIQRNK